MRTDTVDFDGFLKELTELTTQYGIEISGCGCCGSPRLSKVEGSGKYKVSAVHENDPSDYRDYLTWEVQP